MADWEDVKENSMPLKRGRKPSSLVSSLGRSSKASQAAEFESRLAAASHSEDPLSVWIAYIRWVQDNYPSGSQELLTLLERCTREFKDDDRYKNNEKYLKVWIAYADLLDNPSGVFKYLREHGIGEKVALYYVATAWTAERRGDFPLADKAYQVGMEKKAQPIDLLLKRHRQFQRRMSRRWLDQAKCERDGGEEFNQEDEEERQSLRTLSERDAGRMHRPIGRETTQHPNVTGRRMFGGENAENVENMENIDRNRRSFKVFEERGPTWKEDDWGEGGKKSTGWKRLQTKKEQAKENDRNPTPWTNQGFSDRSRGDPVSSHPLHPPVSFGVYVDVDPAHQQTLQHDTRDKVEKEEQKLRERPRKEKTEAEVLLKKPLANFTTKDKSSKHDKKEKKEDPEALPALSTKDVTEEGVGESLRKADEEDMTINTRMAMDDMFEMFGSPSMKNIDAKPLTEQVQPEATSCPQQSLKGTHSAEHSSSSGGFSIFLDEDQQSSNESSRRKESIPLFHIPQDSDDDDEYEQRHKKPSTQPFSIFTESTSEQDQSRGDNNVTARSRTRRPRPFSVFGEEEQQVVNPPHTGLAPRNLFSGLNDEDDDAENFDIRGRRINETGRSLQPDEGRVLKEKNPLESLSTLQLGDESEDDVGEQKESEEVWSRDEGEEEMYANRFSSTAPAGFAEQQCADVAGPAFRIFEDDPDSSLGFSPLESIMEATDEADDSMNSSSLSGATNSSAHTKKKRVPFSIFQE